MRHPYDFLTIGDKNYYHCITHQVAQINTLHPQSKIFIYDWGFTPYQRKTLQKNTSVEIIPWSQRVPISEDTLLPQTLSNFLIRYLFLSKYHRYSTQKRLHLLKLCEKVYCFLDHATKQGKPFIFLDADAFPIASLETKENFDIGVTIRPEHLFAESIKRGHYPVNSGVIFFTTTQEKQIAFIIEWLKEMNKAVLTNTVLAEQTSLYTLVRKFIKNELHDNARHRFKIGSLHYTVKIFPGDTHNYTRLEDGVDTKRTKILHVKGYRHTKSTFQRLIKQAL